MIYEGLCSESHTDNLQEVAKKQKSEISATDIKAIVHQGQKFSDELLKLCVAPVEDRVVKVSLARHLGFNHRVAPCRLVIPLESTLTPILPANHESSFLKTFRTFPNDPITIESTYFPHPSFSVLIVSCSGFGRRPCPFIVTKATKDKYSRFGWEGLRVTVQTEG